jgi:formylglycine-generating enzyme required for sulfatase activity
VPTTHLNWLAPTAATLLTASAALAQVDPASGIDFVTVGAVGNAAYPGDGTPNNRAQGRGGVNYEYRIGRYEVTTAQWVEFFNAAYDRPASDRIPHLLPPEFWGAVPTTPNTQGGLRWRVPAGNESRPTGDISWRMAAIYCNWLHNDKASTREAFLTGAYDVSTFGYTGDVFTDQLTKSPGAKYWIPTWDEWLKAAHYDPNKANPDGSVGGWWRYSTTSDTAPAYGPPGVNVRTSGPLGPDPNGPLAQANAGWDGLNFPGFNPFAVPLGAYSNVMSPWGLFDTAGGTREWCEEAILVNDLFPAFRVFEGSAWTFSQAFGSDMIGPREGDFPSLSTYDLGFRIATAIPSVSTVATLIGAFPFLMRRRRLHGGSHEKAVSFPLRTDGRV